MKQHKYYCGECDKLAFRSTVALNPPCMECGHVMQYLGPIKVDPNRIAEAIIKEHFARQVH